LGFIVLWNGDISLSRDVLVIDVVRLKSIGWREEDDVGVEG
jgi:hypothetical protein